MKTKQKIELILTSGFMLAVMIIIFVFSGQTGNVSVNASNSVGQWVLEILGIEVPEGQSPSSVVIFAGLTIRSMAHIFLFAILGIACFLFVKALFGFKNKKCRTDVLLIAVAAFGLSFLYACFDEFHQMFVDGRTSTFRDVGYDSIGFLITILLSALVTFTVTVKKYK